MDNPGPASDSGGTAADEQVRLTAFVQGQVQGVGFRWWTRARALELGLVGSASNKPDGRVEVIAEGPRSACERLLAALRGGSTPGSVAFVSEQFGPARGGLSGFRER
ncbi:acylphosphatase [Nakamurella aerolata]|uniref:acylphosphatase n=1 Tax=Nakamurella aerolata TaxID=1656892 RepID=A0A849A9B5_9ACTN|nr:acylphosphatase [Nakamurella aerolata]NNG37524.1 acylphosphatase [Nakamurella aerolata]